MAEVMEISKSDLAGARDTGAGEFLESTFSKAEEVIRAGGTVHLMQVFSAESREIADIVETLEELERFKSIYLR